MKVCEIFKSIQGESSWAGLPCSFVRLTGCNLKCRYCDTAYAREGGVEMTPDKIASEVGSFGIELVELTGGEPLLNPGTAALAAALLDLGHKVLIETNGSIDISHIDSRAVIIMDIKTPSSGMSEMMHLDNLALLKPCDELKFVLSDRADYEWARKFIADHIRDSRYTILFSPAFGVLNPADLVGWIIEDGLKVRFNMQLHKYIFGPERRGV